VRHPPSLGAVPRDIRTRSSLEDMSRRYATLASLMTGRGGVHEVSSGRLVALPASGSGVERICPPAVKALGRVAGRSEDRDDSARDAFPSDEEDIAMSSSNAFESHVEYVVPSSRASAEGDPNEARSLHVLRLAPRWRDALLADLTRRARTKTRKGYEALERLVLGPDGGVVVSNVGGFQSAHDLLEPETWCYTSDEDDASEDDATPRDASPTSTSTPTPAGAATKGWGLVSAAACLAHERVRDASRGERAIAAEDLYGWLNANDGGDFNKLHEHGGGDSWSGVFYIQCPPPSRAARGADGATSDESESDDDVDGASYGTGALGLRCHDRRPEMRPEKCIPGETHPEKVRYLRYQPSAGDLLLFRGDVLHAVESNGWARGPRAREPRDVDFSALRLSVAFNEDSLANDGKIAARAAANGAGLMSGATR